MSLSVLFDRGFLKNKIWNRVWKWLKLNLLLIFTILHTYLWKMLMPPLPCPKHHVCPQTLSSFGWCLLAPLAASWPLFCCKLVVFHGQHHQQSSLSSNNKNHTKVRFLHDRKWTKINAIPLKRRKGEMNFMKEFMFYMTTLSLSSSCFKKSDLKNISHFWYWTGLPVQLF